MVPRLIAFVKGQWDGGKRMTRITETRPNEDDWVREIAITHFNVEPTESGTVWVSIGSRCFAFVPKNGGTLTLEVI
jgi:hypothetical protein